MANDSIENVMNREDELRRRVQHKIAEKFLNINEIDNQNNETDDKTEKLSDGMDVDEQRNFENKFQKYRKKETPYNTQNVIWLIVSLTVLYYTDLINVVLYHRDINRVWFNIGAVCILINTAIALFLIGWLCYVKKIPHNLWEQEYPVAIPTATACFLVGSVCVTVGLWPVWGFFTPVILFAVFMGVIVTIAMLPNF